MSFYCEKQHDVSDCAAACLVSIAHYYGYHIRVARVRELADTDLNGTNIEGIIRASESIGLKAEGIRCNKEALFSYITYPCIAHVIVNEKRYHYVVIYKVTEKYIWIGDPARGVVKIKSEHFYGEEEALVNGISYRWTGIIVTFEKSEEFQENKGTTFPFFVDLIKREKKLLTVSVLVSIICTVIGLGGSFYYKILIDTILPNRQKQLLTAASVGILLVYIFQFGLGLIRAKLVLRMGNNLERHMVNTYMEKILGLPMHFFERRKAGDLVNRFRDADNIKDAVSSIVITVIIDGIFAVAGVVLLIKTNLVMFFWSLVMIAGYALLVYLFNDRFERYNAMALEYGGNLSSGLIETFNGMETVKAYNMETLRKEHTEKNMDKLLDCMFRYGKDINLQSSLQGTFDFICTIVILWIGGLNVMDGTITVGELILLNALFSYFTGSVQSILNLQPKIQTAVVAANRILEIIELRESNKEDMVQMTVKDGLGNIEFDHVTFGYRFGSNHITDVCLSIKKGEKIVVVGENGSGKSTLFKLLLRFYEPNSGQIRIDGVPIQEMDRTYLRSKIGYVNQETFFFGERIRENLTFGTPDVTDEEMIEICKLVKVHDFITSLTFGYDTVLQEGSTNLSSGQKQRLALARALLKRPDILILDEFTSNIDFETESEIIKLLLHRFSDVTIIVITHNIQMFKDYDKMYQMNNGVLKEITV